MPIKNTNSNGEKANEDSTKASSPALPEQTIAEILGQWRTNQGILYRDLRSALVCAIDRGDLPRGSKIPSERVLSELLEISRGTVASAMEDLRKSGHIESRRGSGSLVSKSILPTDRHQDAILSNPFLSSSPLSSQEMIWFTLAKMPASDETRQAIQSSLISADLDMLLATHGYATVGIPSLREAVAKHYSDWGYPTSEEEILITSGAQQGISLVMADIVSTGGPVVIEDPSYSGAVDFLQSNGVAPIPLRFEPGGRHFKQIRPLLAQKEGGLVYLVTSFHNPTGGILSEKSRVTISDAIKSTKSLLVEDSSLSHVTLDTPPPLPVSATMGYSNSVVIDSISKVFWGGLRVGWVRSNTDIIRRLSRLKSVQDLGTPILSQVVGTSLLPRLPEAGLSLGERLRPKLEFLTNLIDEHLPEWTYVQPDGGLCLWITIPLGEAEKFAELAMLHGVAVVPGNIFSATAGQPRGLRIPFVLDNESIQEGVLRLTKAWKEYKSIVRHPSRLNVVV